MDQAGGRIIFLNGTSSSGKSSIAKELLDVLDEPWFHLAVDSFHGMRARKDVTPEQLPDILRRTWQGFHRAVAGMAAGGNDVVVDHLFSEEWRLRDCLALFDPARTLLVGVRCPLPELERRERERGDRPPGLAARQYVQVHAHGTYDVEVDTSVLGPRECAEVISAALAAPPAPTAFQRLALQGQLV